jgi:phage regulator Rha-like protein
MAIQPTSSARSGRRQEANLVEKFSELRSQLDQIQQVAATGQQLLDSLAPDLEELTTWMQEMETIVGRWKGPGRSQEDAA